MDQRNETVIATGSSGLIGAPVLRRLARSFRAVGFDRESNPTPPREAECVCVDIGSEQSLWDGLDWVLCAYGDRIASIIHLAAYYDFSGKPSAKYEEITVRGTERLICGLQDFDVERGDIPIVSLGIPGVYDDERRSIPIAHHIQRIYERQGASHLFPGDPGRGRQSFVHQDDLLSALERVVERRSQLRPRLALLIAEPEAPSYGELQEELGCLIHGEEWRAREVPESVARAGAWRQGRAGRSA